MAKQLEVLRIKELHDLMCPMEDGVELATDVYMPAEGGPFPTILLRTPYDRGSEMALAVPDAVHLAQRGYAVVLQDVRGRYDSDGEWCPFVNEVADGHSAIEWTAKQTWSNGKVGTIGASYFGLTQWQAAQGGSTHLIASVPRVAYSNVYHNWVYTGGAFQLAFNLNWSLTMATRTNRKQHMWFPEDNHLRTLFWHLPVRTSDEAAGRNIKHWKDWVDHPTYSDYWRGMSPIGENYGEASVSAYNMAGWFDVFLQGSLNNFIGMTRNARNPGVRRRQKLIVGPWIHLLGGDKSGGLGLSTSTGDVDFGPNVVIDLQNEQVRWFNCLLKGEDDRIVDEPRVKVFVMGANRWRESDDWPIPDAKYTKFYFHSQGKANSLKGDGELNTTEPTDEQPDRFAYDPMHPVPTVGGSTCCMEDSIPVTMGPRDQRPIEYREDVLCYTSEPLVAPLEVTGPVNVVLYASSTAKDTDWVVKLVDVAPNGFAMNVAQGILRARFRDSWEKPKLMQPGEVYRFAIDLWSTSNCFLPGHRIRVDLTSSCFPQFDRNLNTGNEFGTDTQMVVANQSVLHDGDHPSHIVLPVIPEGV